MQMVRQRVVDRLDLRVGEQRLVRAVGLGNAERIGGASRPVASSREAIARISRSSLFFIPGSTRSRPILAVLNTPQMTFFDSVSFLV